MIILWMMNTDNFYTPHPGLPFRLISAITGLDDLPKGGGGVNVTQECLTYMCSINHR